MRQAPRELVKQVYSKASTGLSSAQLQSATQLGSRCASHSPAEAWGHRAGSVCQSSLDPLVPNAH